MKWNEDGNTSYRQWRKSWLLIFLYWTVHTEQSMFGSLAFMHLTIILLNLFCKENQKNFSKENKSYKFKL